MKIAWCPAHRGVMRIAFFDTVNHPHFNKPCPRCKEPLVQQTRNKYPNEQRDDKIRKITPAEMGNICFTGVLDNRINTNIEAWEEENNFTGFSSSTLPTGDLRPTGELCYCCRYFSVRLNILLCGWCVDCPVNYCDVPNRFKKNDILNAYKKRVIEDEFYGNKGD